MPRADNDLLADRLRLSPLGVIDLQRVLEIATDGEIGGLEDALATAQLGGLPVGEQLGVRWNANDNLAAVSRQGVDRDRHVGSRNAFTGFALAVFYWRRRRNRRRSARRRRRNIYAGRGRHTTATAATHGVTAVATATAAVPARCRHVPVATPAAAATMPPPPTEPTEPPPAAAIASAPSIAPAATTAAAIAGAPSIAPAATTVAAALLKE